MKISHTLSIIMYEMYCDELLTQGGGGHFACMYVVCQDRRWHIRNPAQCRVVEGIIHVYNYVVCHDKGDAIENVVKVAQGECLPPPC